MVECAMKCGRNIGRFTDDMLCFHCERKNHESPQQLTSDTGQRFSPLIQGLIERIESLEYSNDMMKKALGETLEYKGQNDLLTINEKYLSSKVDILLKENKILEERLDSMKERLKRKDDDDLEKTLKTIDQFDHKLSKIATLPEEENVGVKQVLDETLNKLEQLNSPPGNAPPDRVQGTVVATQRTKIKIPTPEEAEKLEDEMKASSKPKSSELVDRLSRPTNTSAQRAEDGKKRRGGGKKA